MIIEALTLIIALIWLVWRGPLCAVILAYYVAYWAIENTPAMAVIANAGWLEYYVRQSALDVLIIVACCYLSFIYQKTKWLCLWYAFIVGTSQALQFMMIIDPVAFAEAHAFRQLLSIPLDLTFAVLGSGFGDHLLRFANRLRAAYNQRNVDNLHSG